MNGPYDVIVIGCGGVGSAALAHLARRGARVLGIEQFAAGHDQGSSHGRTRIIREAYFEHPNYVPLVRESRELWAELETSTNSSLLTPCGLLEVGPADGIVIPGVKASASQHGLRVNHFSAAEAATTFPQFSIPDHCVAVFEQDAGVLHVDDCVAAHLRSAREAGAQIVESTPVRKWSASHGEVAVETDQSTYRAKHLVITAGAWSGELLQQLEIPLQVLLKRVYWFKPHGRFERFQFDQSCPIYYFELPFGHFYGFPIMDDTGLKTAEHSGGIELDRAEDSRHVPERDKAELERINRFLSDHLPQVVWRLAETGNCLYTMSQDGDFVIDRHPEHPHVVFAAGLSGHGFKFTPVLGKFLADAVLDDRWDERIEFLRAR